MIEYNLNDITLGGSVILTRNEKITGSEGLTMTLSKSIIFEKEELSDIIKLLEDYADKNRDNGVQ
jgi:hypothetical protein